MTEKKGSYIARRFHDPLDDVLDRPIAFNPAFKKITGSTVAAMMLSQGWYWSKRTDDEDGWFYKTGAEWEEETGLTRSEQETARKILRNTGVWEEDLRGVPATMYYRINRQEIYSKLGIQFAGFPQTGLPESDIPDSGIPANIKRNTGSTAEITQYGADTPNEKVWKIGDEELPVDWQVGLGTEITTLSEEELFKKQARDAANLIEQGCVGGGELAYAFMVTRGLIFIPSKAKGQRKAAREMLEAKVKAIHVVEATRKLMQATDRRGDPLTVVDLFSVCDTAIAIANQPPPTPTPQRVVHRATQDDGINMAEAKRRGLIPG